MIDAGRILTFPTVGPTPDLDALATWLSEQGEPYEVDESGEPASGGRGVLVLRALPVRLVVDDGVRANVEVTADVPLTRLVLLLADLSSHLRAELRLAGVGVVDRAALWLRFADLQDRQRIAAAVARADVMSDRDEVLHGLWSLLVAVGRGRDLRWDVPRATIIEVRPVGTPGGLSVTEAAWHDASVSVGDTVSIPVDADLHMLAWRWLAEAWPSLTVESR